MNDFLKKIERDWEWYAFGVVLIVFFIQAWYFASNINLGVSPDELHHLGLIRAFSGTWLVPSNSSSTFAYGAIESRPWLYYWIMGRLSFLNFDLINEIVWLRFINISFSVGTVFFTFLTAKELLKDKLAQLTVLVMLSNTLMFVFLSGSINYDNLANLCAIVVVYLLIRFIRKHEFKYLVWYLIAVLFSTMIKNALWPFVFITAVIISRYIWNYRKEITKDSIQFIKQIRVRELSLLSAIVVLGVVNVYYFGNNVIRYRSINPSCNTVLSHEQCMNYAVYNRNDGFRDTLVDRKEVSFYSYFTNWIKLIPPRVYGIMGHKNMLKTRDQLLPYYAIFAVSVLLFIRRYKTKDSITNILSIIILFYTSFLLVVFNYLLVYKKYLVTALAVQGRYLFPVLGLIYILMCMYLFKIKNNIWRICISISIFLLFVSGGASFFQKNVTAKWLSTYDVVDLGLRVNKNDHIPNGITESKQFTQTFYSEKQKLIGLEVFVSVFGKKEVDDYVFVLYEENCETVLEESLINGETAFAIDNSYHSFLLTEPLDSKDKTYCFTVNPKVEQVHHPITLQQSKPDVYKAGDCFFNGKLSDKDIVFNLIYKKK